MIPSRTSVLLAIVPLLLGAVTVFDASLVWPMLATDLAIGLAMGTDALLARRRLVTVTRSTGTGVFSVGRPNVVRLELRSLSARPLRVQVKDDLFRHAQSSELPVAGDLPPRGRVTLEYRVTPTRRGAYRLGDHHVRYRSPLGLWIRQLRIRAKDTVRVYPDVQAVRAYELQARQNRELEMVRATRMRGGESEFECLREYTRDDEYRSIDWKATAHKRKLISRQYQLERNQTVMFALDSGRLMTARSAGLPLFDHALNSALMLGHVAVRTGDQAGLFAFSDQVHRYLAPTSGPRTAGRMVKTLFDLHPRLVESNFHAAFLQLGAQLRKRSLIVLFTQIIDDTAAEELLRTVRSLRPRHLPLCVLFRDPDLEAMARPDPKAHAPGLYDAAAASELLAWRDKLLRDLKRSGALVLDVEPADLTPSLINRYFEVKVRHLL